MTSEELLQRATECHLAGDLSAARELYQRLLDVEPLRAVASFRLGVLELQAQAPDQALPWIEAAIAADPGDGRFHLGRGQALAALGRWQEAMTSHEEAVRLRPEDPDALGGLGALLLRKNSLSAAEELLRAALDRAPRAALHRINLGIVLCRQRRFADAEGLLRTVLGQDAHQVEAAYNLGIALQGLGRAREAAEHYRFVLASHPDRADALINLGNALQELAEFTAAGTAYEAALRVAPDSTIALNNLGCLLRLLGHLDEAEALLRRGVALEPDHATLRANLGNVLKDGGQIEAAISCFREALRLDPADAATHGNLAYSLSFYEEDPRAILAESVRWSQRFAEPLQLPHRDYRNSREPDRRLRVGYVSPDFRDHCQALFTLPLLSHHDRAAFEIFAYASVERPDTLTRRIAAQVDVWRDVRTLDDAALANRIREDGIDILIDLTMHMANGRPLVFARQPAPIQIAWLAYPGTTGSSALDYRLTDPRLDPLDGEAHYTERSAWLPDAFWVYDPLTHQPEVGPLPALTQGYVTFGCLNNPCKVTDRSLALWARALHALPRSRLVLLAALGSARTRLLERLNSLGIDAARVGFVPYQPRALYLNAYREIDLGLDSLPYNGHTTSLDAFWMGVPVVSRVGTTCVGRGGLSQLYQLDLLELAATSDDAFIDAVTALASDLPRLAALRGSLRARLERSPLMDAERFTRNLETFYRRAWQEYCARHGA